MRFVLIFGILLIGLYLFGRWSLRAGPARTARALRGAALGLGIALLLLFAARGGASLVGPLLILLIPLLSRWRTFRRQPSAAGGKADSSSSKDAYSTVESDFLRMSLHHASGKMRGTVINGSFAGRELADMNLQELLILWRECQQDAQSIALLEAYLDSSQYGNWRERVRQQTQEERAGFGTGSMSRDEAYEILGLNATAGHDEIKAAHRRLMQRVHPDHGGSTYLAAQINQAKKVLLGD